MGNSSGRHSREIATLKRDLEACEMLKAGHGFQAISDALKYGGAGNACRAIKRVKKRIQDETEQTWSEYVEQQWERLEGIHEKWWPKRGSEEGARVLLRVYERGAALRGLDAPKRTEHTGAGGGPLSMAFASTVDIGAMSDEQIDRICAGDTSALASAGGAGEAPPSAGGDGPTGP